MAFEQMQAAAEAAHVALWNRFVDEHGVILDYVGPDGELYRPTPEECLLSKPNGMSWGAPIENGSFAGGIYLDGAINRWLLTGDDKDRERARTIAAGLSLLGSVGETRGFIARGVSDDGHSHFPIGSNDQTTPWLYGMWRYVQSDIPSADERAGLVARIVDNAEVLVACDWQTPCDRPPFRFRNCLAEWTFESAPRLLWICKMMADLTGDGAWQDRYEAALTESNPDDPDCPNRFEISRRGMVFERPGRHSWTSSNSVTALRGLWELEDDPERRQAYAEGLARSVELAAESLPIAFEFDHDDPRPFSPDWRVMNELWYEASTIDETVELARRQMRRFGETSPRWSYECSRIRESLFGAWIISLCPNAELVATHVPAIAECLQHFQWERLNVCTFFAAELAYYQLRRDAARPPV